MKSTISVSSGNYGFAKNWTLICSTPKITKSFYLGQDVKVCSRILGISPSQLIEEIGCNDFGKESTLKKLGTYIANEIGLNGHNIKKLESWEIAAE
tara:strand:- start:4934 stop:5221 length:288 start_codon:yes stop_codon:yes gene_type:complete